jgi:MATE family multidrug resistance protein
MPTVWRDEFDGTIRLALPVVLAELGWMAMGLVDTVMVGGLGPEAIGAVGLGTILILTASLLGLGLLLGLDTFVAQAFGAGALAECHRWLRDGVTLAFILSPSMVLGIGVLVPLLPVWGIHPSVAGLAAPYMAIAAWSLPPLLLFTAFRRYLQAIGVVRPVMVGLVSANVINVAVNWVLIGGHLGAPALGTAGAAWATLGSRIYMAGYLLVPIVRHEARHPSGLWHTRVAVEPDRLGRLVRLGTPAALQLVLEGGVFAAVTALAGRLDPVSLAAHQIALNVAGTTFMVPLGVSSAAAVRVGHAVGRRDPPAAGRAGWVALALGVSFMGAAALVLIAGPVWLVRIFSSDATVLATGVPLLRVAAMFQLFDGTQVVLTGALRGLGDTRTAMLASLVGYWVFGLPAGSWLCFRAAWGIGGLWVGLSIGLIFVACLLLLVWTRRLAALS